MATGDGPGLEDGLFDREVTNAPSIDVSRATAIIRRLRETRDALVVRIKAARTNAAGSHWAKFLEAELVKVEKKVARIDKLLQECDNIMEKIS